MTDRRKLVILGKIDLAGKELLSQHGGYEFVELPDHAPQRFEAVGDAEAIIVRMTPIDEALLNRAPALKVVSRHGVGYDTVDVRALEAKKIPLFVTGDVNSGAVAEHTLALMLALAKRVPAYDSAVRSGNFAIRDTFSATELSGRRLLVVGYGRIGRKVAALASAFGMEILVFDPYLDASAGSAPLGIEIVDDLHTALGRADIVSVHVPKGPDTMHLIDTEAIAAMPRGAAVINVSRGGLVDQAALCAALESGQLSGAALDTFETEPPGADEPILRAPGLILTPHSAAFTRDCAARMSAGAAENVIAFFEGRFDRALVINPAAISNEAGGAG